MTTNLANERSEDMLNTPFGQKVYAEPPNILRLPSSGTFTKSKSDEISKEEPASSSSYTLASNKSGLSNEVDLWLRGGATDSTRCQNNRYNIVEDTAVQNTRMYAIEDTGVRRNSRFHDSEDTGVQNSRVMVVQRSTLAPTTSLDSTGMWYLLAMILPLFSINNNMQWRCTPSTVLHAAEFFLMQLSQFCGQVRAHVRRLAHDQIARDLFATAMDIVLVVYAIGFLVLSLYQASIIG